MLGLRTIRAADFEGANQKAFTARFGCNEPAEIEFRFNASDEFGLTLQNRLTIKTL
jgi:hypothetical protein